MLKPHPTVLRRLVEEYETLTTAPATAPESRIADLAYTLCVSTGTGTWAWRSPRPAPG